MGEAIVKGLRASENAHTFELRGSVRDPENAKAISRELGIPCFTDNAELARSSDLLVLCVKPHQARPLLDEINQHLSPTQLLISICASVTCSDLNSWAQAKPAIIRAMPNTPCLIGEGMTVLAQGPRATKEHVALGERIFSAIGRTAVVEEHLMDGVTGLSGCGPAYAYLIIEALSEAGVKIGLPRKLATLLASQTLMGASRMVLERKDVHPAAMKDEVTTPAGCTIDGLMALEEGKLRVTLIKAVLAATRRSKLLRKTDDAQS